MHWFRTLSLGFGCSIPSAVTNYSLLLPNIAIRMTSSVEIIPRTFKNKSKEMKETHPMITSQAALWRLLIIS